MFHELNASGRIGTAGYFYQEDACDVECDAAAIWAAMRIASSMLP
jgi:hypothetical protein